MQMRKQGPDSEGLGQPPFPGSLPPSLKANPRTPFFCLPAEFTEPPSTPPPHTHTQPSAYRLVLLSWK